jgi:catalase (peroxidase I)
MHLRVVSGVMRRDNVGFDSPNGWTQNNFVFDNGYYRELVGPGTTLEEQLDRAPNWQQRFKDNGGLGSGVPSVFQWEGYPNNERIVMLNADIALVRQLHGDNKAVDGQVSCPFVPRGGYGSRCPMARSDLFTNMVKYRNDNKIFLEDFRDAFIKMTHKGYRVDNSSCDKDGICRLVER